MNLEQFAHLPRSERLKLAKLFQRAAVLSRPIPRGNSPDEKDQTK
jgi:hypothetical protein